MLRSDYVQEEVRPCNGREASLGYERYIAIEHMDKVRPGTGREGALGYVRRDWFKYEFSADLIEMLG